MAMLTIKYYLLASVKHNSFNYPNLSATILNKELCDSHNWGRMVLRVHLSLDNDHP